MKELQRFSSKYIEHIDKNLYLLSHYEKDKEQILEKIITEKYKSALTTLSFKEEDLVLVRTVGQENFPINLEYYPLDERNCYRYIDNPFKFLLLELKQEKDVYADITIGYDKSKLNIRENELVAYGYRNTKHFSINGLASNIYGPFLHQLRFDNGITIIIESLKGKIEDSRLVNLNPVDTFFDLENSSMKIDENAIILIQESQIKDFFNKKELKEKLKTHRIYLYQDNPSLAVDLVLMYHGYVPQHSKQQCLLDIEYCDYQGRTISDENYLNQWKEFIEKLNQKYLNTTYINVPDSINIRRVMRRRSLIGLPGVLHIETAYFEDEQKRLFQENIATYEDYLSYLFNKSSTIDSLTTKKVIHSIKEDIKEQSPLFRPSFYSLRRHHKMTLLKVLEDLSYPEFKKSTEEFNKKKLLKIDTRRKG